MFKQAIYELQSSGCSIIFSSHQMEHIEMFCEKLIILVKGKVVLEGYLKDIKKNYRKKNIHIVGDIEPDKLKEVEGVIDVTKLANEYVVKIADDSVVPYVFKKIANYNVSKFITLEPTLNEIFIESVGEKYES